MGLLKLAYECTYLQLTRATITISPMAFSNFSQMNNDEDFITSFETCRITKEEWTHKAHIRMAWFYLKKEQSFGIALEKMRRGIQRLNISHGNLTGYHETVTQVFALYIDDAISKANKEQDFEEFYYENPWLYDGANPFRKRHYSDELWRSDKARQEFVVPDLLSLPKSRQKIKSR